VSFGKGVMKLGIADYVGLNSVKLNFQFNVLLLMN